MKQCLEDVCRYSIQALVAKVPLVPAGSSKAKAKLWLTAKNNTVVEIIKSMGQVQYALYTLQCATVLNIMRLMLLQCTTCTCCNSAVTLACKYSVCKSHGKWSASM